MFKVWVRLGLNPDSFWEKSPQEASVIIEARWDAEVAFQNRLAWLAWHIASLSRAKRLPRLDRLQVKKPTGRRRQTWEEQLALMDAWASRMATGKKRTK